MAPAVCLTSIIGTVWLAYHGGLYVAAQLYPAWGPGLWEGLAWAIAIMLGLPAGLTLAGAWIEMMEGFSR